MPYIDKPSIYYPCRLTRRQKKVLEDIYEKDIKILNQIMYPIAEHL